jgi:hypothetical protein
LRTDGAEVVALNAWHHRHYPSQKRLDLLAQLERGKLLEQLAVASWLMGLE